MLLHLGSQDLLGILLQLQHLLLRRLDLHVAYAITGPEVEAKRTQMIGKGGGGGGRRPMDTTADCGRRGDCT